MLRSEIITGIQALRYEIEKLELPEGNTEYFDNILCECRMLVLQNEANDPYAKY
tara:strand:+ start:46 stop:207 length:162 start_codon:yes stop_codon:yes gene_type:complete